jgi:hypothetical protein
MTEAQMQRERELAIASGLNEREANCWVAVAEAAAQFLQLPPLHGMEVQEACIAFHVIQDKLMKRVAYRKYLQLAQASAGNADAAPLPNESTDHPRASTMKTLHHGDGDGLPDAWERKHGLNEADATDASRVAGPEGWTHLELWLNSR